MTQGLQENIARLEQLLEEFREQPLAHRVNGERRAAASGRTFENLSPVDNLTINRVAAGDRDDVDLAVAAASAAFPAWREVPGGRRREILHAVADAIESRADDIALIESFDTGQPLRFMANAAIRGAENFRFYADKAPEAGNGLSTPAAGHVNFSERQPIGPVGVITPWNTPFMLSTWKIAPALAAGCTVVHKPAEWSPLTASVLADVCHAAGLPPGVLNTVHGLALIHL